MAKEPKSRSSDGPHRPGRKDRDRRQGGDLSGTLKTGLFSHIDDRDVPCRIDGCDQTWTWTGVEQLQALGKPPPERMCEDHLAQYHSFEDREIACRNTGCENSWTWKRGAQLMLAQRGQVVEPPTRMCQSCYEMDKEAERKLSDREVPCRVSGCSRTWLWTRDAQIKHRAWASRAQDDTGDDGAKRSPRKRRGRKRRAPRADEPPARLCEPCHKRQARLGQREVPCKVHGCKQTAVVDKEIQLQAWVKLDTDDLDAEPSLARRMCETCRAFCRQHPDREVECGRPDCDRTWTFKTGAQLQAFLAGRHVDPIRLCADCSSGDFLGHRTSPDGQVGETMPCIVPGCRGTWTYVVGTSLDGPEHDHLPLARMCADCRNERGAEPTAASMADAEGATLEAS